MNILIESVPLARVRKDLRKEKLSVPVGDGYYGKSAPLPYRWVGKEESEFEVFYGGFWLEAYSIDWEFI